MALVKKKFQPKMIGYIEETHGTYRFGIGNSFIDGNFLSGPDIERAVNGNPLPDEEEDDRIW